MARPDIRINAASTRMVHVVHCAREHRRHRLEIGEDALERRRRQQHVNALRYVGRVQPVVVWHVLRGDRRRDNLQQRNFFALEAQVSHRIQTILLNEALSRTSALYSVLHCSYVYVCTVCLCMYVCTSIYTYIYIYMRACVCASTL